MTPSFANRSEAEQLEAIQRMRFRRALARKKRKERELSGEIRELNITAMMDIMTIILVFLLKAYSSSAVAMSSSQDVHPPASSSRLFPHETVSVTVTPEVILVGDKTVLALENGALPASVLQGRLILPLAQALKGEVAKLKFLAEKRPNEPFRRELSVIGDRNIPYDLLLAVLYTAGQSELEHFRFVVLKRDE
jgi:biopolymer transport protein ExbD